jgi:hypothetical protein
MEKLIVPVYLNQKIVFDLLAMLQGGISTVTAYSKTSTESESQNNKISVGFGLSEALSTLLRVDLSGEKDKSSSAEKNVNTSEERVHTPASLFYQLRNKLEEKGLLVTLSDDKKIISGDFIEFKCNLSRNPIIEAFDSMAEMLDMANIFGPGNQNNKKGKHKNQYEPIIRQIRSFSERLKTGDTIDLTTKKLDTGHNIVITAEVKFLNDPQMSDLVDGEFTVLGKVVKSVEDETDHINLLRKNAISKMPENILNDMAFKLSALSTEQNFDIPDIVLRVPGPALQIIPVAIYT